MAVTITNGPGSPEGVRTADVASLFQQSDGVNGRTLWRKRLGTGNAGWGLMQGDLGWHSVQDYGAKGDGMTNDAPAIQNAISTAAAAGGVVYFPRPTVRYKVTVTLSISSQLILIGSLAEILQSTPGLALFSVTASNVEFHTLQLTGPQFSNSAGNETAIDALGSSAASPLSRLVVDNCLIGSWGGQAIRAKFVNDIFIGGNKIDNCWGAGIQLLSCSRALINGNTVNNIVGASGLAYGIQASRAQTASLTTDPRSVDASILGNNVRNITNWSGIDTHAGQRIQVSNNVVFGCNTGLSIGPSKNGPLPTDPDTWAPLDCTAIGNTIDSGLTAGVAGHGIVFKGADTGMPGTITDAGKATGVVVGNIVRGHGLNTAGGQGGGPAGAGILLQATQGLVVSGNTVADCSPIGVELWYNNFNSTVSCNAINGSWSSTLPDPAGIKLLSDYNLVHFSGNYIGRETKKSPPATFNTVNAVMVTNLPNNFVALGDNGYDPGIANPVSDAGSLIGVKREYQSMVVLGTISTTSNISPQLTTSKIYSGSGSPEGVLVAGVGSLYLRTDGAANTSLYVKQTGVGNTGWAAK